MSSAPESARPSLRAAVLVTIGAGVPLLVLMIVLLPWGWSHGLPEVAPNDLLTAGQVAEAETVSSGIRHLGWASLAVTVVVSLVLALTPVGRGLVRHLCGPWWLRVLVAVAAVLLISDLVTLPFAWGQRRIALAHGLTHQSAGGYLTDRAISLGIGFVTTGLVTLVLVAVARRLPRRWPVVSAVLVAVFVVVGSYGYPLVVEPLFNSFKPMPASALRSQIEDLAVREHVRLDDVLVADASKRTTSLNAYVSGFGSTRRVVVYDNLLQQVPDDQILSVIAHELGHARHDDVLVGTGLGALGGALGIGLLALVMRLSALRRPLGARSLGDPAAVPLLLGLLVVAQLLASPVENAGSRAVEARADHDALVATHDPQSFVELQVSLARAALSDPTPPAWSQWWFGSHPTMVQRVAAAEQYAKQHGLSLRLRAARGAVAAAGATGS